MPNLFSPYTCDHKKKVFKNLVHAPDWSKRYKNLWNELGSSRAAGYLDFERNPLYTSSSMKTQFSMSLFRVVVTTRPSETANIVSLPRPTYTAL